MDWGSVPASTEAFKSAMRHVPTGVTVITTVHDGHDAGFTANAFASISADPPMLLICVNRSASSHGLISASGIFCVSLLAREQRAIAEKFAGGEPKERFTGVEIERGTLGTAIIARSLAHFDCRLAEEHTAGTHTIFIGQVVACNSRPGEPLGYYDRTYRDFGLSA